MLSRLVPIVAFQAVWLACAAGAASGRAWIGIAATACFLALQLLPTSGRAGLAALVVASGATGNVAETLLLKAGVIGYSAGWPSATLAPAWIVALWLAFGATLPTIAEIFSRQSVAMLAIVGAVAGPLSYLAGERLGALTFPLGVWPAMLATAAIWAAALPPLLALATRFFPSR